MTANTRRAGIAWLLAAIYYFYQYVMRSAPSVMLPELSGAFSLDALGVASLVGLVYYGYAPFSLIAGAALDRLGARTVIPVGALMAATGAVLFGTGNLALAQVGRFLQGAGGVFALVGAVYIASRSLPASQAATLIGVTQMFGMAGGSAGQFAVGPMLAAGLTWHRFWWAMGIVGLAIAAILFFVIPREANVTRQGGWIAGAAKATGAVFRNRQSILCGFIAGLLFIPTTIFDMVWGVRFLQEAHELDYGAAVLRSATVPLGWILGAPALGWLSDRLGRRKPVIAGSAAVLLACLAWILFKPGVFPPYVLGTVAGFASGAAMIPYTVIKEINPPQYSGTATGVINFLNFTVSALLGPVFGWVFRTVSGQAETPLEAYQITFHVLLYGVAMAIALTFLLKETGPAAQKMQAQPQEIS